VTDIPASADDEEQVALSDLLSHVLDKGLVITGDVIISVAGIDLITVSLSVLISALETLERKTATVSGHLPSLRDLSVLPPARDE
jgi:gas vesicle structural protein